MSADLLAEYRARAEGSERPLLRNRPGGNGFEEIIDLDTGEILGDFRPLPYSGNLRVNLHAQPLRLGSGALRVSVTIPPDDLRRFLLDPLAWHPTAAFLLATELLKGADPSS